MTKLIIDIILWPLLVTFHRRGPARVVVILNYIIDIIILYYY